MVAIARIESASQAVREATRLGQVQLRADRRFDGIKVFCATAQAQRERLGEAATTWLEQHCEKELVDITVTQSMDAEHHCVAIVITYREK